MAAKPLPPSWPSSWGWDQLGGCVTLGKSHSPLGPTLLFDSLPSIREGEEHSLLWASPITSWNPTQSRPRFPVSWKISQERW